MTGEANVSEAKAAGAPVKPDEQDTNEVSELEGGAVSVDPQDKGGASDTDVANEEEEEEEEEKASERDTLWHRLARETQLHPSRKHSPDDIDALAEIAQHVQLLSSLPKKHLRRICSHMGVVELEKDEVVFYQGSVPHCLYLVLHGGVSVYLHEKLGHADLVEREVRERTEREKEEREKAANMEKIKATGLVTGSDHEEEDDEICNEETTSTEAEDRSQMERMPLSWEAKKFLPIDCLEPALIETEELENQRLSVLDAAAAPAVAEGLGRFLVTLHAGSSFGEQALVVEDDENIDKRRNASCVAQGEGVVLLTVSREDFDRVVRTQLMQEVKESEAFLRNVALFSMVNQLNACITLPPTPKHVTTMWMTSLSLRARCRKRESFWCDTESAR